MADPGSNDVVLAIGPIVDIFDSLRVRYRIGGSIASSALGTPRTTLDVDIACELKLGQVTAFAAPLKEAYYVDEDMLRDAIRRQSCANLIHFETMLKVDLFFRRARPFEDVAFERSLRRSLSTAAGAREFDLTTPEDIILHKLEWFRAGGETSERQWRDAIGVLQLQAKQIDRDYLERWATSLGLDDLLRRAFDEAVE